MKFYCLTLFPDMVKNGMNTSITGRAIEKGLIELETVNIRDFSANKHLKVDDYPYGGGAGLVMQAEPVYKAYESVCGRLLKKPRVVFMTPCGKTFHQKMAEDFAKEEELIFLCGHYEGIDERVLGEIVTDYISIGDYVLTGGELPAMVMIDAVARLIPGVLGNDSSAEEESFFNDLLEYPQYSRPEVWHGKKVPEVLLSGDHRKAAAWRLEQAKARTAAVRPDLFAKYETKQRLIQVLSADKRNNIHMMEGLARGRYEILYGAQDDRKETDDAGKKRYGRRGAYRDISLLLYDREHRICMVSAEDEAFGQRLADMLPDDAELAVTYQPFLRDILTRRQYKVSDECAQMVYTKKEVLPVRHKDIRRLAMEDAAYVCRHYRLTEDEASDSGEYIRERIQAGAMYGAFAGDRQIGFAGIHTDGCIGMVFVEEAYRRQGVARSLEGYAVNRLLERGWTPYVYVHVGNEASERLQEKLGFYKAQKTFWWMEKVLANRD